VYWRKEQPLAHDLLLDSQAYRLACHVIDGLIGLRSGQLIAEPLVESACGDVAVLHAQLHALGAICPNGVLGGQQQMRSDSRSAQWREDTYRPEARTLSRAASGEVDPDLPDGKIVADSEEHERSAALLGVERVADDATLGRMQTHPLQRRQVLLAADSELQFNTD
jgi:hypothetical protein